MGECKWGLKIIINIIEKFSRNVVVYDIIVKVKRKYCVGL